MFTTEEWKSVRASQKYPIADDASCISEQKVALPNNFLLDVRIITPASNTLAGTFYISRVYSNATCYIIQISYLQNNESKVCLQATVSNKLTLKDIDDDFVSFVNIYKDKTSPLARITGTCCVGQTLNSFKQNLKFDAEATELNKSCIIDIQNTCLQAIKIGNTVLTGIVELKGSEGIIIEEQDQGIIFKVSANYIKEQIRTYYADLTEQYKASIKTINGIKPDDNGNINIIGLDCVSVSSSSDDVALNGTITISNPCSKPCCSISQDVVQIQNAIAKITEEHQILKDYYNTQLTVINYMQTNLSALLAQGVSK